MIQKLTLTLMLTLLGFTLAAQDHSTHCQSTYCHLLALDEDMRSRVGPPEWLSSRAGTATFVVDTVGFPRAAAEAFVYATDIWASFLISDVPIEVAFVYIPLGSTGTLGVTLANGARNFPGAAEADVWYASSLADAISGVDQQPGESDMYIIMNSDINWYFGLDGNTPSGQHDFVSVALHELGHGLGFTSLAKEETNGEGSLGRITAADFGLPFLPIPDLLGLPGRLDRFILHNGTNKVISDTSVFKNPSVALSAVFKGNDLFLNGFYALEANMMNPPKIYAPPAFSLGSSVTHLDQATYPSGDTNSLMTPFLGTAEAIHHPGPIVLGIFRDMGWPLTTFTAIEEEAISSVPIVYPNPFSGEVFFEFELAFANEVEIEMYDQLGRKIWGELFPASASGFQKLRWNGRDHLGGEISKGLYVYRVKIMEHTFSGKILKR